MKFAKFNLVPGPLWVLKFPLPGKVEFYIPAPGTQPSTYVEVMQNWDVETYLYLKSIQTYFEKLIREGKPRDSFQTPKMTDELLEKVEELRLLVEKFNEMMKKLKPLEEKET